MSTAKLLFRGAGLQVFTVLVSIGSSFFLMPFVIHSLGDRWYGLWILVGSFVGFYSLLDLGTSTATQRYLAHAIPRNDSEELNTIIASSLTMFCGIATVALLITLGVVVAAPLFMGDSQGVTTFREVTFILGAGFALSLPFYTQFGILTANLRVDYSSYIQIGKILLRTLLFFVILSYGYGVVALALISVGVDLLGYLALVLLARRLAPWLKLGRRHFHFGKMRELIGFGIYVFIAQVAGALKFRTDNLVIAGALGLGSVTHFNISTKLNGYFFDALSRLIPAPTSIFARYHGKGDLRQIKEKFLVLSRINTIIGMLGIGAALIFAQPFITLWVGKDYLDAFLPFAILMTARIPSLTQSPGAGVMYAMAKHKFSAYLNLSEAVANLVLSLLLVHWYGIVGVAIGTAIPLIATRVTILPIYICRIMNLPVSEFLKNVIPIILVASLAHVPMLYAMTKIEITAYWQIGACVVGYYVPVLALFYIWMLTPVERQLFSEAVPWAKQPIGNKQSPRAEKTRP